MSRTLQRSYDILLVEDNPSDRVPPADLFALNSGALLPNCLCNFLRQIKIASNTLIVGTLEPKHRLGIGDIDRVLEVAAVK